jgi:osmotically inducible lipoprotein OsmB
LLGQLTTLLFKTKLYLERLMKTVLSALLVCLTVAGVSACDNMTTRQRDTAIGAAGGGVAGALLGGGTLGTLGGAAAGGIIGNQVGK